LPDGAVADVAQDVALLTLDVLRRTMFAQGLGHDTEHFRDAMRAYFDSLGRIDPFDALGLPAFLARSSRFDERTRLRFFDTAIDAIIEERRGLIARSPGGAPRDLLTLLLEAADNHALAEAEVRAN